MANSVTHFELFATDVERARKFYERVFGWTFEIAGGPDFYLIATGPRSDPGLTQGLIAKRRAAPAEGSLNAFRCTISVRSIAETMAAIQAEGGKIRGSMAEIPDVGRVLEFADTEGNVGCIMQHVPGHPFEAK